MAEAEENYLTAYLFAIGTTDAHSELCPVPCAGRGIGSPLRLSARGGLGFDDSSGSGAR